MWKTVPRIANWRVINATIVVSKADTKPVLRKLLADYLQTRGPIASIAWQRGEPLLVGLPFFQQVVAWEAEYALVVNSKRSSHSLPKKKVRHDMWEYVPFADYSGVTGGLWGLLGARFADLLPVPQSHVHQSRSPRGRRKMAIQILSLPPHDPDQKGPFDQCETAGSLPTIFREEFLVHPRDRLALR